VVLNDACMIYYVMAMSGMYWTAGGSEDRCAVAVDQRIGGTVAGTAAGR
jgi:hypothetical protein